jgi:hypothetical protein
MQQLCGYPNYSASALDCGLPSSLHHDDDAERKCTIGGGALNFRLFCWTVVRAALMPAKFQRQLPQV